MTEAASPTIDDAALLTEEAESGDLAEDFFPETGDADEAAASTAGDTAAKATSSVSVATIRRIAKKAEEIAQAATYQPQVVTTTASILGCGTGLAELTTAIMTAPRGSSRCIGDLQTVAEADPFEMAMTAAALPKDRRKALWGLLTGIGALPKGTSMPASEAKAGLAAAKAIRDLDPNVVTSLEAVASLLKKY